MKHRILSGLLTMTLVLSLSGCGTPEYVELPADDGAEEIAYVPLDDRPDNLERVIYLAESLGYQLSMPPLNDFRTRLAAQPKNDNGTQFGDREALLDWVLEREAEGCDRYILSMDQLLSGGLVNSRSMHDLAALSAPGGELEQMETLLTSLSADADNEVWLLDSVMRLAPTVGYDHWDLDGYNALRAYGMAPRPVLTGDALSADALRADYPLGRDGLPLSPQAFALEDWEVEEYLSARSRKLELSTHMMSLVENQDNFHVLIGIDDSAEEDSIQKNEIAWLRTLLRPGDALLSGVDDLAFKAVAKLYLDSCGWQGADAAVRYFGGAENEAACAYDYQPLRQIVAEHLDFFALREQEDADLQILVLTQPADESKAADYIADAVDALRKNQEQNKPTILIDAGNGRYGTAFHQALTEKTELGSLLSYSGFLDMAIVTGTALSHGVARYAFLQSGTPTQRTETAFVQTLADSVLKDFCYKHIVREDLLAYVRNDLGGSPDNFWAPELDLDQLNDFLRRGMEKAAKPVLRNLERSGMIARLQPYAEVRVDGLRLSNYRFPWDRAFEIGMDIELDGFIAQNL